MVGEDIYGGWGQGPRGTVYICQRARGGGKVSRSGGKGHLLELGGDGVRHKLTTSLGMGPTDIIFEPSTNSYKQ